MKKWILLFCFLSGFAFAQDANIEIGERIYKTVIIDGEEVKKWVVLDKFTQFNNDQNPVYEKSDNDEIWWKYNDKGHIKRQERKGSITNFECDDKGRIIHSRWEVIIPEAQGTIRIEVWNEYNPKENMLYVHTLTQETTSYGDTYEKNGNQTHIDGKPIHYKDDSCEIVYKYDENGNIYQLNRTDYGPYGSVTYTMSYKTNTKGNVIYKKDSYGMENWYEYNSNEVCVYEKAKSFDNSISEYIYEYTYWDNGKIKTCSKYKF
ncbi:MAG: hypothetical protein K2H09_01815 [Treponemataceae bacterium]|nr:hypothetical protein [Treponemataceae bacterium]